MCLFDKIKPEQSLFIQGGQSGIDTVSNINPSDISDTLGDSAQASKDR